MNLPIEILRKIEGYIPNQKCVIKFTFRHTSVKHCQLTYKILSKYYPKNIYHELKREFKKALIMNDKLFGYRRFHTRFIGMNNIDLTFENKGTFETNEMKMYMLSQMLNYYYMSGKRERKFYSNISTSYYPEYSHNLREWYITIYKKDTPIQDVIKFKE